MAFLKNNCLLLEASKTNLSISKDFDCGDPQNKTGCRYIIVEGLNDEKTITFYTRNGFKPIFSNEIQEAAYYKLSSEKTLKTRLLYFDLILLVEN